MKLALIILGFFFLSLTVRSRELTFSERATLASYKKTITVKSFMELNIRKVDLSMRDYIVFLALGKSCNPTKLMIRFIENQKNEYSDQSKILIPLMSACEKGSISLSHLYITQQED